MDTGSEKSRNQPVELSSISASLLERVKANRPEAWNRLVSLYGPVVYQWCRQYGVARDDAPDLVQEVFAAVALHIGRFHRDRPGDSFAAWLRTVTHNKVRNHLSRRRGRPAAQGGSDAQQRFLQLPDAPEPSAASRSGQLNSPVVPIGLEQVRLEFENRTWDAFYRTVVDGQSPAQVAAELGMTIQAVYKAKSRVLRRLRQELDGLTE